MPTYEYACSACGERIEVVQSMRDEPLTTCGNCGGELRKVFHPAGILFKGSGFYSTDNRTGKKPSAVGTGESKSGESKGGSKGESKKETSAGSSSSSGSSSQPAAASAKGSD
jgi:putative FmdB family regulatory protein